MTPDLSLANKENGLSTAILASPWAGFMPFREMVCFSRWVLVSIQPREKPKRHTVKAESLCSLERAKGFEPRRSAAARSPTKT